MQIAITNHRAATWSNALSAAFCIPLDPLACSLMEFTKTYTVLLMIGFLLGVITAL